MDQQLTDEELAIALQEFTNGEESEQESAVAPGPTQGVPQLEIYNIDLDGAHPSLFATQPGQIYHPASGPQKLIPYHTDGFQETTVQDHRLVSSPSSGNDILTPYTPNISQGFPTSITAPTAPYPPIPAGINPEIFAGALQAATTAPPFETHLAVPWPTNPYPQQQKSCFPPPPSFLPPQHHQHPTLQMPPPPPFPPPQQQHHQPPELLSDYPHLHRTHHKTGYRDGLTLSRAHHTQPGFDAGYRDGITLGLRAGKALGMLEFAMTGSSMDTHRDILARAAAELEMEGLVRDFWGEMQNAEVGMGLGNGVAPPPPPPPPPQQQQMQMRMVRFGPPPPDPHVTISEPMVPLTVDEALRRWEGLAVYWQGQEFRRRRSEEQEKGL